VNTLSIYKAEEQVMGMTKAPHKAMCVTMTVEEAAELRKLATRDGETVSGWLAAQVRSASSVTFPERRSRGIHLESGGN